MMTMPYVSEWDYTIGCFEEAIFSLNSQGKNKLASVARRKNYGKYVSVSDFMFAELAGKHWSKNTLLHYQGKGDILMMHLQPQQVESWAKTIVLACRFLNSTAEFKTWSSFRRTVLLNSISNKKGN